MLIILITRAIFRDIDIDDIGDVTDSILKNITTKNVSHMGVSKNNGTPKSSILIGFFIINHPFWGTPTFGNIHILRDTVAIL